MMPLWKSTASVALLLAVFCAVRAANGQVHDGKASGVGIVIIKSARAMTLERDGQPIKTYKVALGSQPVGAKHQQGNHKTPEGQYFVDAKIAHSQFHMALHLSYPSAEDRARARKQGVSPGGDVEIHGLGKKYGWIGAGHSLTDWTDGCIAVTNEEISEIFRIVPVGTLVEIKP
jgi:murein L,D-transpeptidase YafK